LSLLIVNTDKCKKDGICAADCPMAIIQMDNETGPRLVPGGDETCLRCGHCVAVCPHAALSHKDVPLEKCVTLQKEHAINMDQAIQFLRSRRSIRVFKDKPVEKRALGQLIEIGHHKATH